MRASRPGAARAVNATTLIAELDALFATKPLDEWAEIFAVEPDFFWSPVNSIADVLADDQFHAAGGVVYVPDGESAPNRWWPRLPTSAATPWEPRSTAPALGEHTEEILGELARPTLDGLTPLATDYGSVRRGCLRPAAWRSWARNWSRSSLRTR